MVLLMFILLTAQVRLLFRIFMAHFSKINKDNLVEQVIVIDNKHLLNDDGDEVEALGQAFIKDTLKLDGDWQQCSYNKTIRGNYPAPGYTFDKAKDEFIPPAPFASWTYNYETHLWEAPVAHPDTPPKDQEDQGDLFNTGKDEYNYQWNEKDKKWDWVLVVASEQNSPGTDLSD